MICELYWEGVCCAADPEPESTLCRYDMTTEEGKFFARTNCIYYRPSVEIRKEVKESVKDKVRSL